MSSEEQFEHIEHKIKEAAENNHIVFEETAWEKMETLLDKEDKRKPFFWLWFLVPIALLSAYGLFMFTKNNDGTLVKKSNENKVEKINTNLFTTIQIPTTAKKMDVSEISTTPNNDNATNTKNTNNVAKIVSSVKPQNNKIFATTKKGTPFISANAKKGNQSFSDENNKEKESYFSNNKTNINKPSKTKASVKNADATEDEIAFETTKENKKKDIVVSQKINTDVVAEIKKDSNTSIAKTTSLKKETKKTTKLLSRFYVVGAAGADVGSVKLFSFNNSSFSAKYGASMGFDITKRLSVQAGFYASKKKYVAGAADYNIKAGSYWSMVPITKVEAACLIYEVPIVLQYQFLQRKSFNAYVGAGASSYIMKTEDYNYFYKRYNVDYSRAYSYSGNQHLFSTALFSAGFEKNITKKFIVQLEPTISVPLKGVGDGAVKLYSTSLLLAIKYKPFNK